MDSLSGIKTILDKKSKEVSHLKLYKRIHKYSPETLSKVKRETKYYRNIRVLTK